MFAKGQTVIQLFEQWAPKHYAIPDDRIGLQLGTLQKDIRNILVALDITDEVAEEAIREQADLIIAHHALIYRPLKNVRTDEPQGRVLEKLIKHDIAVYIAHTNLDAAEGGINDMMADRLNLQQRTCLEEIHTDKLNKLVVFVPESHHPNVQQAIFAAGAGWIGDYSHCSFNLEGTGTFLPQEGSRPFIGSQGKLERVKEIRLETVVPQSVQRSVIQAMLRAHPYEEVAYDLYPLDLKGRSFGLGRVGLLPDAVSLKEFVERVKAAFDVPMVRYVGEEDRPVRKVALLGGSGSHFMRRALFAGADVYLTGDVDYHTALDAAQAGLAVVDPGHNIEKIMKRGVTDYLTEKLRDAYAGTRVLASRVDTEPFRFG